MSATAWLGLAGSSLLIVSVALRAPPSGGLKRTVSSMWLPAPIVNGVAGAPTTLKSPGLAPENTSEVIVRSQRMQDDWLVIVSVRSIWCGVVRLSTGTPPKSIELVSSEPCGTPGMPACLQVDVGIVGIVARDPDHSRPEVAVRRRRRGELHRVDDAVARLQRLRALPGSAAR